MRKACKCHGVSGSCSIQTCWMQLADFREVGNYLKMKHEQAKKLEMDKKPAKVGNSADNRGALAQTLGVIAKTELIYLEDSPDYCVQNQSLGYLGTKGRECLKSSKSMTLWERKSCPRLCFGCGLRVAEKRVEVVTSCNCKFHWCCTVKCEKCTQIVTKYYCARKDGGRKRQNKSKRKHRPRRPWKTVRAAIVNSALGYVYIPFICRRHYDFWLEMYSGTGVENVRLGLFWLCI